MEIEIEPPQKKTGRPSSYTFEVSEEICRQMAEGKGLRQICAQEGMPDRNTVLRWVEDNADFRRRYARGREACMDWYQEEILRIAFDDSGDLIIDGDRVLSGHHVVQRARLKVDSLKWVMSKLAPKKYGERPETDDGPQTVMFQWLAQPDHTAAPEPPRQIEYRKPELPADLTEADWSIMLEVLELVKRTVPTNDERPPEEIFGVMKQALLAHFRQI
jgi:hypothetical protein